MSRFQVIKGDAPNSFISSSEQVFIYYKSSGKRLVQITINYNNEN